MPVNPALSMPFQSSENLLPHDHFPAPDLFIDITTKLCPMTFVHTRLALDRIKPGQVLEVRLAGDEPRQNVPRTATEQGHELLAIIDGPAEATTLLIRKKAAPPA